MSRKLLRFIVGLIFMSAVFPLEAQNVLIKMGTLAPEGTAWHDILLQMKEDWRKISAGRVTLRIYPSGVLGDEPTMIRRMRIRQLDGVAITGNGLSRIEPAVSALMIPMMLDSYEELDYVRDRLAPRLEGMIEEKGFKILNWGDAGWVYFFTKKPASSLDEIRKMKLLTSAGDPKTEELYKDLGFQVVPLAYTEVLTALQTGMVEAVQGPPLYAMVEQWFGPANNMIDVKWSPLIAATVLRKDSWEKIPADLREPMLEAARVAGRRLLSEIRGLNDDAISAMQKRGLNVIQVDEAQLARWRSEADKVYPELRGRYVPADLFDEVQRLRDEFRQKAQPPSR